MPIKSASIYLMLFINTVLALLKPIVFLTHFLWLVLQAVYVVKEKNSKASNLWFVFERG